MTSHGRDDVVLLSTEEYQRPKDWIRERCMWPSGRTKGPPLWTKWIFQRKSVSVWPRPMDEGSARV